MELERKFLVIADIIQAVCSGQKTVDDVKSSLTLNGMLRSTEVESLIILAAKLGFIEGSDDALSATKPGLAFEQYITSQDEREMTFVESAPNRTPVLDKANELKLCVTVPPKLLANVREKFEDSIVDTRTGQRMVADDCTDQLIIVSPYIDPAVLQLGLASVYSKSTELVIITSEESLVKYQGNNYFLSNLKKVINNRFACGKVLYFSELSSIAHAKVWCCQKSALITSANVQSNSTTENLEIGIYTDDPALVSTLWSFLKMIVSDGSLKCILDTRL